MTRCRHKLLCIHIHSSIQFEKSVRRMRIVLSFANVSFYLTRVLYLRSVLHADLRPYPRNPHPSVNKHSAWWLTLFVSWPPDCVPLCFANSKFESSCSVSSSGSFSSNFSFLCRYFFARGVWGGGNGIRVRVSFFFRYRFDLRSSLKSKIDWFARFVSRMQQMETSTDKTP